MARRAKDELPAELRRLGALYDAWRDYEMTHGPPSMRDLTSHTMRPSEDYLAIPGPGGPRLSKLLGGFQQAVNDISEQIRHALEDGRPEGHRFLAFYRERTGRDW